MRPHATGMMMRFEVLPGEFSQHDFGEVRVSYLDGNREVVRFFCSRLKWSRWAVVDLVPNQVAETLIRTLADHFARFGGVPLCAVFDRPKTVALKWAKNGEVTTSTSSPVATRPSILVSSPRGRWPDSPSIVPRSWRRSPANVGAAICSVSICWRPARRHCSF